MAAEQDNLIAVLLSDGSPRQKDAACARLKRIGDARCVPALAALLPDDQLSHSARYVLESMPGPEAGAALVAALDKTSGPIKAGVIYSLGFRGERLAVPALIKAASDSDSVVAVAAMTALGEIGGPEALQALEAFPVPRADGPLREAWADAILRRAEDFLASEQGAKALPLFQRLSGADWPAHRRMTAFRGVILASGKSGLAIMTHAIAGPPGPEQVAALGLVHEVRIPGAPKAFLNVLPQAPPPVQVALIEGLSQRGDRSAASGLLPLANSDSLEVRTAVCRALGRLGDGAAVPVLLRAAASGKAPEQTAARLSLAEMRGGNVTALLLDHLAGGDAPAQTESARALGERGDSAAVPKLLELARKGSEATCKAALNALGRLADQSHLAALVELVLQTTDAAGRAQAAETVSAACQRIQSKQGRLDVAPIVKGLTRAPPDARVSLLPVCSGLVDGRIRSALRAALAASESPVRAAALRALCDTRDPELLQDLVQVVQQADQENFRTLAVGACVRLTTQEDAIQLDRTQRLAVLESVLAAPLRPEQQRLLLAGLGEIPDVRALKLVEPLLEQTAVKNEAAHAAIKIAAVLPPSQSPRVTAALKKAIAVTDDAPTRQAAEAALKEVEASADFITTWQVAGPYLREGKDYAALFEIPFPPETDEARTVRWQDLPAGADPKRPWLMDLLKALGGEQRVAYARTWVHSPRLQRARLEIGSDDGVKVWFNAKVVHAVNTFRGIQPGSEKINVTLDPGWNLLLLKVTQLNLGWEFCARFRTLDGSPLEGLRFEAPPSSP